MSRLSFARAATFGLLLTAALHAGCGGQSPTPPSPVLTVNGINPGKGSTSGSTSVKIVGDGFVTGTSVRIDDVVIPATVLSAQVIQATMPAHAAGLVNITAVTPSGASATLRQSYLYEVFAIASVVPTAGVPEGSNVVSIVGSDFAFASKVTFDGVAAALAPAGYGPIRTDTLLPVYAPAHAAGAVDVVVTYTNGQEFRLISAYTYAPSETFDFNGVWTGIAWERNNPIRFTIENNTLTSVACGSASRTFSPAVPVTKGAFTVADGDLTMTGRIWSPIEANGDLKIPGCLSDFGWTAAK
jgi:hypothetical protein